MIEVWIDGPSAVSGTALIEAGVRAALSRRGVGRAEVSVALLDDASIQRMNRDHLSHDRPTDVISFGLWETGAPVVVGDIYIGWEEAGRQAEAHGVAFEEELVRLAVHGTLHVTGMDHPEVQAERPASEMYRLQESIVAALLTAERPER